jgi:hypothetical protein
VLSDDELIERLSMPALGMYSDFKQTGEIYSRKQFSEIWPDADYDSIINELASEDLIHASAQQFHANETRGVLFTQRSARSIRID